MAKKKGNNPLKNQPFFIQFAHLPLEKKEAVSEFLNDAKEPAKQAFESSFPELAGSEQFEPRLSVNSLWQAEIRDFLDAWYKGNIIRGEKDKWLNEKLPQSKLFGDNLSEIGEETFMIGLVNLNLMGFFAVEIREAFRNKAEIRKCASNCNNYFIAKGTNAWRMKYCSTTCRDREAKRRYRKKKKNNV